ncbi:hypothetical protein [Brachybacterium alimentarium]|uniref:hypothetical protein n=1 Tax=Brachybacterium alimentarium TaxID=47845 RepID=UPI000DF212EC|nr:hypothetical protein [Brachybacterium alimentarium]RCS76898.1 hypothetical protein CIK72_15060 [Brachybacterium alimentarium]RCS79604.1 hypothetical protein CIK70_07135 [Brachybacterium alimentarium]
MENHSWPLKKRLPEGCQPFTKADPLDHLAEASDDDAPIWIDNYWQPIRGITQRPVELMVSSEDDIHLK